MEGVAEGIEVALGHGVVSRVRHFYASALIAGGASVKQVQIVLGHASVVITLRICAHCGRPKKTAPGPSRTSFSAACGPGADR